MLFNIGTISEVQYYIDNADKWLKEKKQKLHPGYHYCCGLYYKCTSDPDSALKEFNLARLDAYWGPLAIEKMIDIFLQPDDEAIFETEKTQSDIPITIKGSGQKEDATSLLSVDRLLIELKKFGKTASSDLLECHALMASKERHSIESAIVKLLAILASSGEKYVPALQALGVAFSLVNQQSKAKEYLRKAAILEWDSDLAHFFERSWLQLADLFIQDGKFSYALDLLKKCLKYNKSCYVAWEYHGFIMEKEKDYINAALYYEKSWIINREANASLGYKLALNCLKACRYCDAIIIGQKILKKNPEYPKIREVILQKARCLLKV